MEPVWSLRRYGFAYALVGIVLLALALRLWGVDLRSMSHPEIYAPGIDLVEGISEPPPRHDFFTALYWHYHDEPHPIGWYMAMFGWTEMFGTSLFSLRLPSVLFGAAAIIPIALIGRRLWGPAAGLLAGALLALHGFNLFWNQIARMYSPGLFFGLLSTLLLLCLIENPRPRRGLAVAYVLSVIAGVQCIELFWPLLILQIVWVTIVAPGLNWPGLWQVLRSPFGKDTNVLQVQAVALMLAAPELLHSLYRSRAGAAEDPGAFFFLDFAAFGFLFGRSGNLPPEISIPMIYLFVLASLWIVLAALGLRKQERWVTFPLQDRRLVPFKFGAAVSLACFVLMLWMAAIAHYRNFPLAVVAFLPVVALFVPAMAEAGRTVMRTALPSLDRALSRVPPVPLLLALFSFVAPLLLFAASFKMSVLAPRAFTVFLPYQILLATGGIMWIWRRWPLAGLVPLLAILFAFVSSVPYSWKDRGSPRDYQAIYEAIAPQVRADDLVFLRNRNWEDTPLFYYLKIGKFVVSDWQEALEADPEARVWLITWPEDPVSEIDDERREALAGYNRIFQVRKVQAEAELFVRP